MCMMVASPCKCAGATDRVCNCFLPGVGKDPHSVCKERSADDCCGECVDWFFRNVD